jgi:group I intron endonuclease
MQIYRIFNKIDGKSYIGQTQHTFETRYNKYKWWQSPSNEYLVNAAKKYGIENFDIEILKEGINNLEDLNKYESYYADLYNTYRPNGYNIRGCGNNRFVDDELKKRLAKARLGTNYKPKNKKSSEYKGVYWREAKKSWICRFQNSIIKKDKYASSEIEAAEIYDKISLYLFGKDCFINFEDKRKEYLLSDLEDFYNIFICKKSKRNNVDEKLLEQIIPIKFKTLNEIASILNTTPRKIQYCLKKYGIKKI